METLIAWIVSFMVASAPPGRKTYVPEAEETREQAMERYQDIAEDIVEVVYGPDREKSLFRGRYAQSRTVSVILSLMLHESGFRRDVDFGLGKLARGDQGNSWCLMQLNVGTGRTLPWNTKYDRLARPADPPEEIHTGWTGQELVDDRQKCIRAGLRVVRSSFLSCRRLGRLEWLRVYASGSTEKGSSHSRQRMGLAIRWFDQNRPTFKDVEIVEMLETPEEPAPNLEALNVLWPGYRVRTRYPWRNHSILTPSPI